jgi:hypothetical protein
VDERDASTAGYSEPWLLWIADRVGVDELIEVGPLVVGAATVAER